MLQRIFSIFMAFILMLFGLVLPENDLSISLKIRSMTLEQKIGQMLMPAFRTWRDKAGGAAENVTSLNSDIKKAVEKYGFGGVILFAENCQGTEQTVRLVREFQEAAVNGIAGMPMFVAADQEGGSIIRLQTGCGTCGNMALGAINDGEVTRADAARIASELSALGINTDFAPDLDVNINPSNPVIGIRSFSSSPEIAAAMGKMYIAGMHDENVATAAKHFPGHGDTATDSHTGLPLITKTYEDLKKTELVPFEAGISAGTDMIMTAHIVFPDIEKAEYVSVSTGETINLPATLSKTIIDGILRKDMGYDGVVTTDALNMAAIASHFTPEDAAILAVNAGIDILLMPVNVECKDDIAKLGDYVDMLISAVESGKISENRIDESVKRIIKLKYKRGIMTPDKTNVGRRVSEAKSIVGSYGHYEGFLADAEKAITLIKNDGALPLRTDGSAAPLFLYPYTGEENSISYAVDRLRDKGIVTFSADPAIECYRYKTPEDFADMISEASSVVIFSEAYSVNYINPDHSSGWQSVFIDEAAEMIRKAGKKLVVVSLSLPYDAARYPQADAIVLAYGAKDMKTVPEKFDGEVKTFGVNIPASVCVMFGETSPQGKLPVDIPEITSSYTYSNKILYPVGTGLGLPVSR